jgi:hypothetical protein
MSHTEMTTARSKHARTLTVFLWVLLIGSALLGLNLYPFLSIVAISVFLSRDPPQITPAGFYFVVTLPLIVFAVTLLCAGLSLRFWSRRRRVPAIWLALASCLPTVALSIYFMYPFAP